MPLLVLKNWLVTLKNCYTVTAHTSSNMANVFCILSLLLLTEAPIYTPSKIKRCEFFTLIQELRTQQVKLRRVTQRQILNTINVVFRSEGVKSIPCTCLYCILTGT